MAALSADVHAALPVAAHSQVAHPRTGTVPKTGKNPHAVKRAAKAPARTVVTVTVRPGQSIYSIARSHHSTVAAIAKANPKLWVVRVHPGIKVKVPVPPEQAKKAQPAKKASAKPSKKAAQKAAKAKQRTYAPKPTHVAAYAGTDAARGYSASQVAAGDRHRAELAKKDLPTQAQVRSMIEVTAKRYGVDPKLALAIGWQESGWKQHAVSVCDAVGVMQVMAPTADWASDLSGKKLDRMHTQDNITAGVVTLRYLTQHAKDRNEVIGSYYQGLGAMRAHGPYDDTRQYIRNVNHHMNNLPR